MLRHAVAGFAVTFTFALAAQAGQPGEIGLRELIEAALKHEGRLEAAAARLEYFRAKEAEARWGWFPAITLKALFGGPVGERRLACDPETDPNCLGIEVTEASKSGDFNLGNLGFAVGGRIEGVLPIYTFGKLDGAKRAANAGVRASEADLERHRHQVVAEVRRAYWGWLLLTDTIEVLQDGRKKLEQAESKLKKMLDELNEEVTDRDLFKLRYYGSQLEDWLQRATRGRRELLSVLRFLTGIEKLGGELRPAWRELDFEEIDVKPLERYVQLAWSNRPEMRMMAAAEDAQRAAVEIERARLLPDFFLAGYVEASWSPVQDYIRNPLLQPGLTNYDAALAVGLQMELDVPRKLARLDQQKAELQRIRAQKRQLREAIRLEVERAWNRLRAVRQRWKVQRRAHRAAKSWMRANLMSYGVGVYDTKDLLDSVAAYSRSSIELSQVKHDLAVSLDELARAMGQDLRTGQQPGNNLPAE